MSALKNLLGALRCGFGHTNHSDPGLIDCNLPEFLSEAKACIIAADNSSVCTCCAVLLLKLKHCFMPTDL